jgi:hypothetical protein
MHVSLLFFINNLFSEYYVSWHLFQLCMDFFGQLITQPRSMPGILTVPPPRYAGLAALHPHPLRKGKAASALSFRRHFDLCSIAMRVFRVRATRRRGKAESNSITLTPHIPGAQIHIIKTGIMALLLLFYHRGSKEGLLE